jgi:hypothetical protein
MNIVVKRINRFVIVEADPFIECAKHHRKCLNSALFLTS